jgi:hypothetical protein
MERLGICAEGEVRNAQDDPAGQRRRVLFQHGAGGRGRIQMLGAVNFHLEVVVVPEHVVHEAARRGLSCHLPTRPGKTPAPTRGRELPLTE